MIFSHIVAVDMFGNIGKDNKIPWRVKADMDWFRKHTLGKVCIVGRKTFESFGRSLAHRTLVVVTSQKDYKPPFDVTGVSVVIVHSIDEAIAFANGEIACDETMIICGSQIYRDTAMYIDRIYLTEIDTVVIDADSSYDIDCDRFKSQYIQSTCADDNDNEFGASYYILQPK